MPKVLRKITFYAGNSKMRKIDSLTSLRFFASAAIVFMHSRPTFDATFDLFRMWPLQYGVTFFFVLSGFILTYVYGDIPIGRRRDFYIARFARVWPAHVAALLLLLCLLPSNQWIWQGANPILTTLANVTLIHSIIPIPEYYFSYNGVSWSISTEIFFYLAFPFLLTDWNKTWAWKIVAALLMASTIVLACDLVKLPPFSPEKFLHVTSHGLAYINPLTRIFEFVLGMTAAKVAIHLGVRTRTPGNVVTWTVAEVLALSLALSMANYCGSLPSRLGATGETALVTYTMHSSGAIFFAVMVAVFAFQGGILSRLLHAKPLIVLGEISFSLYMVHQVVLRWYGINRDILFGGVSDDIRLMAYWITCLVLSFGIWRFFELPMRSWVRNALGNRFGSVDQTENVKSLSKSC